MQLNVPRFEKDIWQIVTQNIPRDNVKEIMYALCIVPLYLYTQGICWWVGEGTLISMHFIGTKLLLHYHL